MKCSETNESISNEKCGVVVLVQGGKFVRYWAIGNRCIIAREIDVNSLDMKRHSKHWVLSK